MLLYFCFSLLQILLEHYFVLIFRDKRYATLQVDKETPVTATADLGSTQLDTDGMLWIGKLSLI